MRIGRSSCRIRVSSRGRSSRTRCARARRRRISRAPARRARPPISQHECLGFCIGAAKVLAARRRERDRVSGRAGRFRANNGQALKMAALRASGWCCSRTRCSPGSLRAASSWRYSKSYLPEARRSHLIYPRDRRATPKLTSFVDFVIERFGAERRLTRCVLTRATPAVSLMMFKAIGLRDFSICRGRRAIIRLI